MLLAEKWDESPAKLKTLYSYCQQDVRAEQAIHNATPELSFIERQTYLLDQQINMRGIPVDRETILAAIKVADAYRESENERLRVVTGHQVPSAQSVQKLRAWLYDQGYDVPDLTKATVESLLADPQLNAKVRTVLEIRKELSLASVAKYHAMEARSRSDGRVRGAHLYYGAHTGRWSGSGVQFQNVARGSLNPIEIEFAIKLIRAGDLEDLQLLYADVPAMLSSCLRSMVRATEGKRLIVCDFASIEARVLAWVAKQTDVTKMFRDGEDIYVAMASKIYEKPTTEVTKAERFLGKVAVLGLGYGMGAEKFHVTCERFGIEIDLEFAEKVKEVYRSTNSRIRNCWYNLEEAAAAAIMQPGEEFAANKTQWLFDTTLNALTCCLPSGRMLYYRNARMEKRRKEWGEVSQIVFDSARGSEDTYSGKLCENVVQAIARDLLRDAMFRLTAHGYTIVMHVHDEVVCEERHGHGSIEEVEQIMCDSPVWATGLPVGAEGFEAERYRK